MTEKKLTTLFGKMDKLHVVVVGDVMLDNYWWGDVERVSPEAPVPIVTLRRRENRLGGAANVALNCRALGAKVSLASIVGDDADGHQLAAFANAAGIDTSLLQYSTHRRTTTKTRVMSRNQQMMRLDDEVADELYTVEEHPFIDAVLRMLQVQKPQVVIFEDYNKGVLKENVIRRITAHCNKLDIVTAVDPKLKNFLAYREVTIFKPNLKEVREGLHLALPFADKDALDHVHQLLAAKLKHAVTFITLSEKGVYYSNGKSDVIPSHVRNIADVSGAGDTVIATAAIVYTLTKDAWLMAAVSNIAGGLVCEEVGVVPVDKERLLAECCMLLGTDKK